MMPLTITVDVTCDGCGATLVPPHEVKQDRIDFTRWKAESQFMTLKRIRRTTQFYCAACSDKPAPKHAHKDT